MNKDLGIRGGGESVPAPLQLAAHLAVVVDLAVLDHGDAAVLVGDRLIAVLEVDDRESPHRQGDPTLVKYAIAVWPAMRQPRVHRLHGLDIRHRAASGDGHSTNPTHARQSRSPKQTCRELCTYMDR